MRKLLIILILILFSNIIIAQGKSKIVSDINGGIMGSGVVYSPANAFVITKYANADVAVTIQLSVTTAKTVVIDWGNGSPTTVNGPVTSTNYSKTYPSATENYNISITGNLDGVTKLQCQTEPVRMIYTLKEISRLFPAMTYLALYSTQSVITGSLSDLKSAMTLLALNSTQSVITGSLSDLKSAMTFLALSSTQSVITGSLSDLKSAMTSLSLYSTQSVITGGATAMAAVAIQTIRLDNTAMSQAMVDGVLLRLYTDRAAFTYATPVLNISGTNADPSGTYQDGDPPTTGKEYAYELVVDPETEGFIKWTVTY